MSSSDETTQINTPITLITNEISNYSIFHKLCVAIKEEDLEFIRSQLPRYSNDFMKAINNYLEFCNNNANSVSDVCDTLDDFFNEVHEENTGQTKQEYISKLLGNKINELIHGRDYDVLIGLIKQYMCLKLSIDYLQLVVDHIDAPYTDKKSIPDCFMNTINQAKLYIIANTPLTFDEENEDKEYINNVFVQSINRKETVLQTQILEKRLKDITQENLNTFINMSISSNMNAIELMTYFFDNKNREGLSEILKTTFKHYLIKFIEEYIPKDSIASSS